VKDFQHSGIYSVFSPVIDEFTACHLNFWEVFFYIIMSSLFLGVFFLQRIRNGGSFEDFKIQPGSEKRKVGFFPILLLQHPRPNKISK
jgi:hypothetical protein